MLFFLNEIDDFTVTDEIAEKFSKSWFLLSEFEDAPNPSLRYAKVFLEDRVRNADFDEWLDKPIVKIRPSGLAEGFYVESTFHASSPANKENLNLLCEFLKKEKIISVIDNRDFVDAFSNISQEKMETSPQVNFFTSQCRNPVSALNKNAFFSTGISHSVFDKD